MYLFRVGEIFSPNFVSAVSPPKMFKIPWLLPVSYFCFTNQRITGILSSYFSAVTNENKVYAVVWILSSVFQYRSVPLFAMVDISIIKALSYLL